MRDDLRLDGVGRRYGLRGPWILRGVDLAVRPGTLTRVEGANGTGKSTLLRLLARVDAPTEGRVTGRPRTAYVPERFPAALPFTAAGYLTHLGAVHGLSRPAAARAAGEWLERFGAAAYAATPMTALSKGTSQKVAVAQALLAAPELLVLDEAWTGLDADARAELERAVAERIADGGAVVFVDHDPHRLAGAPDATYTVRDGALERRAADARATPSGAHVLVEAQGPPDGRLPVAGHPGVTSAQEIAPGTHRLAVRASHSDVVLRALLTARPPWHVARVTTHLADADARGAGDGSGPDTRGAGRRDPDPDHPGPDRPGLDHPGADRPGPHDPGPDCPGADRPGPDCPGADRPGPDCPGPHDPGPDCPGADRPGPDCPGPYHPGADRPGADRPGPDRPGADRPGADHPGPDCPGPDHPGPDCPGPYHPGADRPGADRPGPDRPGADRPGPDCPGPDHPGPHHPGADCPGPDHPGADCPGPDCPGPYHPGPHHPGADCPGPDHPGADCPGPHHPGPDRPGAGRPGRDRPGADRPGPDHPGPGPSVPDHPGPDHPGPDPSVPDRSGPDQESPR